MQKVICLIESLGSGGAERQMSGLAVLLKQQGLDVEVWTYYPNDFYLPTLQAAGVKYRYIAQAQPQKKRISVLRRELLGAAPDTVIAYLDQACIVACIVKMLGAKFNLIVSERNTTQKLTFRERLKFFFYRFADYIVPNSHTQTRFIAKHYPHLQKKLRCITNFVDTEKFCPAQEKVLNNPLRILTLARIMPQKNIVNYIYAIKEVVNRGGNVRVDWYGQTTDESYYALCKQTIEQCGLQSLFCLNSPERDAVSCYHKGDVFCLPSIYEGFPNVVCEAMCCGLPILCSNVCDNPDIVENGENGIMFDADSVQDMTDAIMHFLALSQEQKDRMSHRSRELSLSKFDLAVFIKKYIDIVCQK